MMMPVPYYLPDDFVMIQFYYGSVNANIQQLIPLQLVQQKSTLLLLDHII